MPTIDQVDGIKINIYYGDHKPPHVHALYNEHEALVEILTKELYRGFLPSRKLKKVESWLAVNGEDALRIFYTYNPSLK